MDWMDGLLFPIMVAVAWIMVQFHDLLTTLGLDPAGGAAWALSIVGLVIVIRILLIPLFFKQIKASRGLQLVQPEMQALQKKYKGKTDPASREAMSREMMELYRKHGTNPFASCLPLLLQSPIFFALFRVLYELPRLADGTYPRGESIGPMTQQLAAQAEAATIFGAPLSGTFMQADGNWNIRIVTVILIIAMSVTTFTTQRQLTMKNMPPAALQGPMAQQQKILLYVLPLVFAFSGVNFPIGVLIYWTTTNLWSMGQQFYTIRRMPAPGSEAEAALKARQARKAARKGVGIEESSQGPVAVIEEKPRGQREQPKRKDRAKARPSQAPTKPASPGAGGTSGKGKGAPPSAGKSRPQGGRPSGTTRAPGKSSGSGAVDGPDAS
ncbi:membrane protein insertase YidC [Cellulomonas sp.]|uniref:membrane protein insertase YidC n=1 Tax=Cellulomonas sp. TaxID=40001 RepID=UPI002810D809|nr:membrane protein insertase YidC [Cellulomonas sp.]